MVLQGEVGTALAARCGRLVLGCGQAAGAALGDVHGSQALNVVHFSHTSVKEMGAEFFPHGPNSVESSPPSVELKFGRICCNFAPNWPMLG